MTLQSPIKTNQVLFQINRPFSAEGFHKLDVIDAFREIGYSHTEAKRLLSDGAIKVWDSRVTEDGNHWEWYKRKAETYELMELPERDKGSVLLFGHPRILEVLPEPVPLLKRLFRRVRPNVEKVLEDWGVIK